MLTNIYTIGISGASCSGKTWLANEIKKISPAGVTILPMDSYYKNIEFVNTLEFRHDNPESMDYDRFLCDLIALKAGDTICLPVYDYDSHKVVGYNQTKAKSVLVVEGLFAFYDERVRKLLDLKIWTSATENVLFTRRMERDLKERGDSYESAKSRYVHDVKPAYTKYIDGLKVYADIVQLSN